MNDTKIETTFRSFKLILYIYGKGTYRPYVGWWGPSHWRDQIEQGCQLWASCPMGLSLPEFLDKLDIGRTTPKGTK